MTLQGSSLFEWSHICDLTSNPVKAPLTNNLGWRPMTWDLLQLCKRSRDGTIPGRSFASNDCKQRVSRCTIHTFSQTFSRASPVTLNEINLLNTPNAGLILILTRELNIAVDPDA